MSSPKKRWRTDKLLRIKKLVLVSVFALYFSVFIVNASALERSRKPTDVTPTVVLSNFATHDNSYRSSQTAIQFSELLQIALMEKSSLTWVEREEISLAMRELKIGIFGLSDSASTLQLGRWLKADLLIKGDFYRRGNGKWTLEIEVIDLDHADVASRVSFSFPKLLTKSP